ncbi:NAD(P)/FAD-dependent oxidoreductase [Sneathiella limimaris]|uniref:NAD(P)/FAD-dependent oxidoreductase n=1 Tax=Sneathiella limimaris TaxID=1964213 RepID=UPI003B831FD7
MDRIDTVIVGAGVIGLAIARYFAKNGHEVLVLEKHPLFGEETSSRNSEVIHAGIYYQKGSLKARLCVEGKAQLYQYAKHHNIPHKNSGKLIVATTVEELDVLTNIKKKAKDNGVMDLEFISENAAKEMEPALHCKGALHSPSTGIIDTHQYMLSLVGEVEDNAGFIAYNTEFQSAEIIENGFLLSMKDGTKLACNRLINSAGLAAQAVSKSINGLEDRYIPTRYLTKGNYFTMSKPSPFNRLIYPVPNTASLGVHVTLDLAGQIRFGPDQEWVTEIDYSVDPNRAESFYGAIRQYYPDLPEDSLTPAYCGIRPKIQGPNDPMKDFCILGSTTHNIPNLVLLYGMESPGLTSSLAIAEYVYNLPKI